MTIKELRVSRNLTQAKFAELIGVDRSDLGKMENGKKNISDRIHDRIWEVFGVEVGVEEGSLAHIPGGCALPVSATSIGATLHWRDCAFSVDLSSDEISATGGRQSFARKVFSFWAAAYSLFFLRPFLVLQGIGC